MELSKDRRAQNLQAVEWHNRDLLKEIHELRELIACAAHNIPVNSQVCADDDLFLVKHWFCFSYQGPCDETGVPATASAYVGYPCREVTKAMIDANKAAAGVAKDSALIAVSYLGEMTRHDFLG